VKHWIIQTAATKVAMTRIYSWEAAYREALEETQPDKIVSAVVVAQEVLLRRIRELEQRGTRRSINELAWLEKAVDRLAGILAQPSATPGSPDKPVENSEPPATPPTEVPLVRTKSSGR
jgi:hypothetical protein